MRTYKVNNIKFLELPRGFGSYTIALYNGEQFALCLEGVGDGQSTVHHLPEDRLPAIARRVKAGEFRPGKSRGGGQSWVGPLNEVS